MALILDWSHERHNAPSHSATCEVAVDPEAVRPVLQTLRADPALYVKKSVANVLRNASGKHPEFVLDICRMWARSKNSDTRWIVKDG